MVHKAGGFYHPANEDEIRELIEMAVRDGLKLRVRGSGHSVNAAIYTGDFETPPPDARDINIFLDRMRAVTFDDDHMRVTAQAGVHLGADPSDPTGTSTLENSLFYQIDQRGWAFPDTGGIIHQTVGGFLSTGSSGGSVQHSVGQAIVRFRVIDGAGQAHEFTKPDDRNDPFYALGVSLGLLGVITEVTFQCVPKYNVAGKEVNLRVENDDIDLFGPGDATKPGLERYLRETEHARLLWWPQAGVEKVTLWEGRKIADEPGFQRKPYQQFPRILGSQIPAQVFIRLLFRVFRHLNPPGPRRAPGALFANVVLRPLLSVVINAFLPTGETQTFQDVWWRTLPMDNTAEDDLLPTEFTEMWLPLEQTAAAMTALRDHYRANGLAATGTYACEIYATKRSDFWLSPAYQRDVIKFDMFWFEGNPGRPERDYYPQFWTLFKAFDYRFHWGKHMPVDAADLRGRYPKWDDFMALRAQMDPHQIFVSDYWRRRLGIAPN